MFAIIQAAICTLYFFVFISEAVTENGPAPCFLKKTHERIRVNRAVIEPIIAKSLNSEDSKTVVNLAEKESPILIKSLDSENTQKENKSSLNEESEKANVTDSVLFISNPENKEKKSEENKSSKENLKDSPRIMESLNIEITKNYEGNLTEKESTIAENSSKLETMKNEAKISEENKLPKEHLTDSAQMIMESLHFEKIKNDEGNSTEKESAIASISSNPENRIRDEKNTTDEESSIVTKTLNSESIKNEEEKSEKEVVILKKSLDSEKTKEEGNFTENDSSNKNITDSVQIVMKPLELKQKKEGNSTEKESGNENATDSSAILTNASNSENKKTEKENVTEKESILKNRTVVLQKSITKGEKSKNRRQTYRSNLTEKEKYEVDEVFLRAYENCKLLRDNYFLRVSGSNPKEIKDCVVKELRKLETYPDEFVKYLDNKEIIRKA